MIVDALLDLLEGLLGFLAGFLPSWDVEAVFDNWGLVTSNLSALNYYLPISEVFAFVIAVFAVLPLFLGASLMMWVVAFVRGGSSRA